MARRALVDEMGGAHVRGLVFVAPRQPGVALRIPAISPSPPTAARRSWRDAGLARHRLAETLGVRRHAPAVAGVGDGRDAHPRRDTILHRADGWGLCNVRGSPSRAPRRRVVRAVIEADPTIRARFDAAVFETPVSVLGPLAVDTRARRSDGLFAGDAAGFADPMTGDGCTRDARRDAAARGLSPLESGDPAGAAGRLAEARRTPRASSASRASRLVDCRCHRGRRARLGSLPPSAGRSATRDVANLLAFVLAVYRSDARRNALLLAERAPALRPRRTPQACTDAGVSYRRRSC